MDLKDVAPVVILDWMCVASSNAAVVGVGSSVSMAVIRSATE